MSSQPFAKRYAFLVRQGMTAKRQKPASDHPARKRDDFWHWYFCLHCGVWWASRMRFQHELIRCRDCRKGDIIQ